MKNILYLTLFSFTFLIQAQAQQISGQLLDQSEQPVIYANLALYSAVDTTLVKVETSDDQGNFQFSGIADGTYDVEVSYVGLETQKVQTTVSGEDIDLGVINMGSSSVELAQATVTARRAMVEVKPDRTVFNVEGTINSAGDNGLGLLRKAPGVLVDNNNNVTVLGRTGVLVYIDGKRLPLAGDELNAYLEGLPAEQIDRLEIITNPGAKYEAEGSAGIIDIRLKKDKSLGFNGTASLTGSKGRYERYSTSLLANYRNKTFNTFGSLGYEGGRNNQIMYFDSYQNNFRLYNASDMLRDNSDYNYRIGTDFFLSENSTIGFLIGGGIGSGDFENTTRSEISSFTDVQNYDTTPIDLDIPSDLIDSTLLAQNLGSYERDRNTFNINYAFNKDGKSLNIDADYGLFKNKTLSEQPNSYFDGDQETNLLNYVGYFFDTPIDIDIATFKVDYELDWLEGRFGTGIKIGNVSTQNSFLFYDELDPTSTDFDSRFNIVNDNSYEFEYDERVYATYLSYNRKLTEKIDMSSGLRAEFTQTTSDLNARSPEFEEEPRDSSYVSFFPNLGLTYQASRISTLSLAFGRRINRPDYNVLNPFRTQVSELDFANGNPALKPEIVNNVELGWTYKYRYNFKLSYSKTTNQITRLIGTDNSDVKASFINWDNLGEQNLISLNISAPVQIMEKWSAYFNFSASHIDNQASYPDGNVIDLQAWNYSIFQQHTINLPKGFVGEISGWYSGPGVWGGVFKYENSYSLNLGLQKKFLNDRLNVKLSFTDVFNQSFWSGYSNFDGLLSYGTGNFDFQRGSISLSYKFGQDTVKAYRDRKTGLEDESGRVGENE